MICSRSGVTGTTVPTARAVTPRPEVGDAGSIPATSTRLDKIENFLSEVPVGPIALHPGDALQQAAAAMLGQLLERES